VVPVLSRVGHHLSYSFSGLWEVYFTVLAGGMVSYVSARVEKMKWGALV
jgi:hypothetical protein